jgi:hypothetical protein
LAQNIKTPLITRAAAHAGKIAWLCNQFFDFFLLVWPVGLDSFVGFIPSDALVLTSSIAFFQKFCVTSI